MKKLSDTPTQSSAGLAEQSTGLLGRELDAAVAERVMSWASVHYDGPADRIRYRWMGIPPDGRTYHAEVRYFSSDIAAAMEVEDRIAELGLETSYVDALWLEVNPSASPANNRWAWWNLAHATAEQRCLAALSLARGEDNTSRVARAVHPDR